MVKCTLSSEMHSGSFVIPYIHDKMELTLKRKKKDDGLMRLTAAITKEENWYVAKCLKLEVTSQGKTVKSYRTFERGVGIIF